MRFSYLRTAFRNLYRFRLYTLINILGLAVGMAACVLVALYLQREFSYDAWHRDVDRICRVMRHWHPPGGAPSQYTVGVQGLVGPMLVDELPEIEDATRFITSPMWAGLQDRGFDIRGTMADPNFLQFFTFPLVGGGQAPKLTPGTVYITEGFAKKLFGTADVVGRTLKVYYKWVAGDFLIAGVLRDLPAASSGELTFDLVVSQESMSFRGSWDEYNPTSRYMIIRTFVRLAPGASLAALTSKLNDFARRHLGTTADSRDTYDLLPLRRQHLYAHRDFNLQMDGLDQRAGLVLGDIYRCWAFGLVGAIILVLACVNFINLSTARAASRALEVGVRKAVGSTRGQLIAQFLGEAVLLAEISGLVALGIVQLVIPSANNMLSSSLTINAWAVFFVLLLGLVVGLAAGIYPALFLSSFVAVQVLKGSGQKRGGRSRLRQALVVFQFAASVVLVIGTLVAWEQTNFIHTFDLGFTKEGLITMPIIRADHTLRDRFESVLDRFGEGPDVLGATASLFPPGAENPIDRVVVRRPGQIDSVGVHFLPVDHNFTKVYGINLLQGRGFTLADKQQPKVLLNETAARALGGIKAGDIVHIRAWGNDYTVIGIFKDFHNSTLHDPVRPLLLEYWPSYDFVTVKVRLSNLSKTLGFLRSVWKDFVPAHPFAYAFIDDYLAGFYQDEMRAQRAYTWLSGLSIFVASLGLLGLIAYTTEVRTKEIGVRKVLGASTSNILILLLKEFISLVVLASLFAWPIAYFLARSWLNQFAYRIGLGPGVFLAGGLLALFIAFSTVSFQVLRAARANPVDSLRYE